MTNKQKDMIARIQYNTNKKIERMLKDIIKLKKDPWYYDDRIITYNTLEMKWRIVKNEECANNKQ